MYMVRTHKFLLSCKSCYSSFADESANTVLQKVVRESEEQLYPCLGYLKIPGKQVHGNASVTIIVKVSDSKSNFLVFWYLYTELLLSIYNLSNLRGNLQECRSM